MYIKPNMNDLIRRTLPLYLIVIGILVIALQNAGIISPHNPPKIVVTKVFGSVEVEGTVDVGNTVDVNLAAVVGTTLVQTQNGMQIGVNSTQNTVIPINWGEIEITR